MIDEQERRGARRASRTWLALFLIALAFAAGELVGAFAPGVSTRVETSTAPWRQKIVELPDVRIYALIAAGAAALIFGLLVYVAGNPRRRGFLILTVLFMLPAGYMGLIPLGRLRALIADHAQFDAKLGAATADRDLAVVERDRAAASRQQAEKKIAELEKHGADQTEPLEALGKKLDEVASGLDKASKAAEDRRGKQDEQIEALRKKLDEVATQLDKSTKASEAQSKASEAQRAKQDEIIETLRKELDELKKPPK